MDFESAFEKLSLTTNQSETYFDNTSMHSNKNNHCFDNLLMGQQQLNMPLFNMLDMQTINNPKQDMPAPTPRHNRRNSTVSKAQLRQNNVNAIADKLPNINYDRYCAPHNEFEYSVTNKNTAMTAANIFNLNNDELLSAKNVLVKFDYKLVNDDSYYLSLLMNLDSYSSYEGKKACNAYIDINNDSVGLLFTERLKNHNVFNKYKYIYSYDGSLYTEDIFEKLLNDHVMLKEKFNVYAYLDISSAALIPLPKHADMDNLTKVKSDQKEEIEKYVSRHFHDFDLKTKLIDKVSDMFNLSAFVDSERIRIKHSHKYCTLLSIRKTSPQEDFIKVLSYSVLSE